MRENLTVAIIVATSNALQLGLEAQEDWTGQTGIKRDIGYYMDRYWPASNCCRLYTRKEFEVSSYSKNTDWVDLCTDNDFKDPQQFNLEDEFKTTKSLWSGRIRSYDWDDKVESFKCGSHVAIQFCDDESKCFEENYAESAAGDSESQLMGARNLHSFVVLTPYDPEKTFAATVFDGDHCNGLSHVVWIDEGKDTSGDKYASLAGSLLTMPHEEIQSVMLPDKGDFWMDLWDAENFTLEDDYSGHWLGDILDQNDDWNLNDSFLQKVRKQSVTLDDGSSNGCVRLGLNTETTYGIVTGPDSLIFGKGLRGPDFTSNIPENCCRLFREYDFGETMKTDGYLPEDLCLDDVDLNQTFDFKSGYYSRWYGETKSYMCGSNVSPSFQLCEADTCSDHDTAAAGAVNPWIEASNYDALELHPENPAELRSLQDNYQSADATLYSMTGCKGSSMKVAEGEKIYADGKGRAHFGQEIYSVWLPDEAKVVIMKSGTNLTRANAEKLTGTGECIDLTFTAGNVGLVWMV